MRESGYLKILICTHDFPPIGSPQSLRVENLARSLAAAGHQLHLLTRAAAVLHDDSVHWYAGQVTRTSAGWIERAISLVSAMLRRIRCSRTATGSSESVSTGGRAVAAVDGQGLNWKGRLVRHVYDLIDLVVFPDNRSCWVRSALAAPCSR